MDTVKNAFQVFMEVLLSPKDTFTVALDEYIEAKNPQSISEVEDLTREFFTRESY